MIKVASLPKEFTPFGHLVFCGNVLINTPLVFTMGEYAPILVGRGEHAPLIWVSLPTDEKNSWGSLVVQNRSINKGVQVSVEKDTTEIKADSVTVIRATQISEDHAEVSLLDLNPLGFHIKGDKASLHVGGTSMTGNMISGSRAFIGLG